MADYAIYSAGATEIPLPEPEYRDWNHVERGTFADGTPRRSLLAVVEWRFATLSAADFQKLEVYRPANGRVRFKTWRPPVRGVAAQQATCVGVMAAPGGTLVDGEYRNVLVRFTMVSEG